MTKTITLLLFLVTTTLCFSQNRRVTGEITDKDGIPLGGVNVLILNSSKGTISDFDGNYDIGTVSSQDTLEFSFMGFRTQRIAVGNQKLINVTLAEDASQLNEVVVTALGIKKEKKALGYAIQEVDGQKLQKAKEPNFVSSLTGRVAGLNIQNSTDLFQDPQISLRGASPLLVIDGIPDRTTDLWKVNSDDIESISVLKGATASALYGSVGRNGAIMITTKKGKKGKLTVTVNNSTMFQPSFIKVPDVQTTYGNGNQGVYAYVNGSGSGTEGGGWIWGPKLDQLDPDTPSGYVETTQYNSEIDPETGELIPLPYLSRGSDNIDNFFNTGLIQSNNVSVAWGSEKASLRTSISNVYQKGIVPNTDLNNTSFNIGGSLNPSKNLSINSSLTYNKQYTDNFPEVGYGPTNYLYNLILWTGADVDIRDLRNYWREEEVGYQQRHFNISYYNNPYFQAYEYERGYSKDNIFGNINLEYKISPHLSFKGRGGTNVYSLHRTYKEPKSYIGYGDRSRGNFTVSDVTYFDITTDFGLKYENQITDKIGVSGELAYVNYFRQSTSHSTATDGLNIPGFYNLDNNAGVTFIANNREEKETIHSVYGFVDFDFYKTFYLSLSGRNDKVSTLPEANNSFFYPSVSASIVFTELFSMPEWITFGKVRGSWSQVSEGKIGDNPYSHIQAYEKGASWNGTPSTYFGNELLSSSLKPETSDTWEVGLNARFLKSRFGVDVAYYQTRDYNNLIYNSISQSSGYNSILLNGDEYKRRGIELVLDGTPVKSENFRWDAQINLSQYRKYQEEIYGDREQTDGFIKVGDRTDRIYDDVYQTNELGQVIFENGYPVSDPYARFIGYDEPDLTYGISNTLSYKNLALSFLFDGRLGGLMYSSTNQKMWWGGTSPGTVNQYRDDANNGESTFIGKGVKVTGGSVEYDVNGNILNDSRQYTANDIPVNYINFMQTTSNGYNKNYHYYKEDFIKLREVTLTYNFSENLLSTLPFNNLSLSLIGRNLWLSSNIPNVDPDPGRDNLQAPATRSIGINLNAKF
ncbi:SusC/RagA family TonB-linked outer membrane protein [Zunongwangia endophytica]|uniref:SusC/RagA family TonB-linked outer membrane protein n=1 Tax=Zunongwangia endophytica TaxID=1808945 RepID=A0ABV8HB11_9FLAO|nr:SusC/RagA family TonB-linked outer membrane protein [Zunongwangia endophytica]MDN3594366.1 SusC/RagA family TonB-linked outer membrane protein [Zunongwangia endophytica]